VKRIKLTKGYETLVDDEDFEELVQHKWFVLSMSSGPRASRKGRGRDGKKSKTILMHRQIMCAPSGMEVDHINHDSLDNRRVNLRVCTHAQNGANQRKQSGTSSRFKGVTWDKSRQKWLAQIMVNRCHINLGRFVLEEDAARAYNRAASTHFGEFKLLNDIPCPERL
jgi:hypothetical protein